MQHSVMYRVFYLRVGHLVTEMIPGHISVVNVLKSEFLIFFLFNGARPRTCALPLSYILSPCPLKYINLFACLYVFMYVSTSMLSYICEGQRAKYRGQLSPSIMWLPGVNLRSSDLVASAFIIC